MNLLVLKAGPDGLCVVMAAGQAQRLRRRPWSSRQEQPTVQPVRRRVVPVLPVQASGSLLVTLGAHCWRSQAAWQVRPAKEQGVNCSLCSAYDL